MTADGYEDNKIISEGLKDYRIPPLLNIPYVGAESRSNLPGSLSREEDHEEVLEMFSK